MNLEQLTSGLSNPATLIPQLYKEQKSYFEAKAFREFFPNFHKVNDHALRPNRTIRIPDPYCTTEIPTYTSRTIPVWRLPVPLQQYITGNKTAFTTGGKVKYSSSATTPAQEAAFNRVKSTLAKEKTDPFKNSEIVEAMLSQTEVAEIWYSRVNLDGTVSLKCNVYTPADGNDLIPVFDGNMDMIAFGRAFKTRDETGMQVANLHLYTKDELRKYVKGRAGEWVQSGETVQLIYGKIPVVYYSLRQSCWEVVQPLIERVEFLLSNHGDENDRSGAPIMLVTGEIDGWAAAGESGKVLKAKDGATAEYLETTDGSKSLIDERNNLMELIFLMTQTVNMSTEKMSTLTSASGEAFERLMMNAHLGARKLHNGAYGLGVQRRLNFLISAVCAVYSDCAGGDDLEITPDFGLFRLDSRKDDIDLALAANGGLPVIDQEGSIAMAGTSDNPADTLAKINSQTPKPVVS